MNPQQTGWSLITVMDFIVFFTLLLISPLPTLALSLHLNYVILIKAFTWNAFMQELGLVAHKRYV